ncbi:MAG: hypothetical protein O2930_00510 [Acidobacteria bacterium]|nr:hypothetical protein [Acidobacteriota bacterium]
MTPYLGSAFAAETQLLVFEEGLRRRLTLGASVSLMNDGLVGLEVDVGHTPRVFEGDDPLGLVLSSRVTTYSGNVLLAAPLAVTRESLRPYLVLGLGLMQARSTHAAGLLPVHENLLAMNVGVGATGFLTDRTGLRFDLRHFRGLGAADAIPTRSDASRLSFWRASVGVTLRY